MNKFLFGKSYSKFKRADKYKNLHIGCGPKNLKENWLNTDLRFFKGIDLIMDATNTFPFTQSLNYIYAEHFLEHLAPIDALKFLKHAGDSLSHNSYIRISTPSLEWVLLTHFNFNDKSNCIIETFNTNRAFHGWGHSFLYSKEMLYFIFNELGFSKIKFCNYGESDILIFRNIEQHGGWEISHGYPSVWIIEAKKEGEINLSDEIIKYFMEKYQKYVDSGH